MPSQTEKLGRWHIFETADAVAEHVAEWLCALACARDGELAICLSGGSTPRPLYQRLASPGFASRVPWSRIHWFWGDERFVPHDDPASNYRMAYDALFLKRSDPAKSSSPNSDRRPVPAASGGGLSSAPATLLRQQAAWCRSIHFRRDAVGPRRGWAHGIAFSGQFDAAGESAMGPCRCRQSERSPYYAYLPCPQ